MDCQTLIDSSIDIVKSLGIDKCPYKFPRMEWTDDSFAIDDGVDNMTIESYE